MLSGHRPDKIKVLIVDDEEPVARSIQKTIQEDVPNVDASIETNFKNALATLAVPSFEAVILDLFEGNPQEGRNEGQPVWDEIWQVKLLPVVIHTAGECDVSPKIPPNNPLLKCVRKHAGSDVEVAKYLMEMQPYMFALRRVEDEFKNVLKSVLLDITPVIWESEKEEKAREELLIRSSRRRLAAMMDLETLYDATQLISWEQYIIPPMGQGLLTGDILRQRGASANTPEGHRLVLTPSCDLQFNKGKCKVSSVLVAKCIPIDRYLQLALQKNLELTRSLTEPHVDGYIPLPEYKSVVPLMAACLRELQLIPIDAIFDDKDTQFDRVASIDSPFREQVAWAYLQISARPAVPNRNLERWVEDMKKMGYTVNRKKK